MTPQTGLEATLEFDAAAPENSSLSATIDPRSIRTEFPQPELVRFDEVLAGPNWLDAAAYPSITSARHQLRERARAALG